MIHLILSLLGIFITIFFVIGTHESAHFITARLLGVKVLRFSIGFGKTLFRRYDKKGTEYVFALIPLGGYVKMLDEFEGKVAAEELPFAFNRQPFYKKFLIVLAGPIANLLCAFILYWIIFVVGFVTIKPIIGQVNPHSIAAKSGLQSNQEIIRIDHSPTSTWTSILFRIIAHAGNQDTLLIETENLADQTLHSYRLDLSNWHLEGLTPDPLASLGITAYQPTIPLIIGMIQAQSPAASSPLKLGDKIMAYNHQTIKNWDELFTVIQNHPEETVIFTVLRNKQTLDLPVKLSYQRDLLLQKHGYLGIGPVFHWPPALLNKIKYNFFTAAYHAGHEIKDFTYFNFLLFSKMVTGKISMQSLGGPITIFESAGEAFNYGFLSFIGFLAFLSISIGIINLLPIPGLDGGHLFIQIIEFIIRRPVPEKIIMILYRLGFAIILFVLIQAFINDVLRLY